MYSVKEPSERLKKVLAHTGMKIVLQPPPNIADIEIVFPMVKDRTLPIFFAYGDVIYNPSGSKIPTELIAHEMTHSLQQQLPGLTPEIWWTRYLANKQFRFEQELEAHRIEYDQYISYQNRHARRSYIKTVANRLAGNLYGNMVTTKDARRLILEGLNDDR